MQTFTNSLTEGLRPFEFVVGEVLGGVLGGVLMRAGVAANTPGTMTRSVNTVVAISNGLVVPWDGGSADAGTKVAVGVAPYAIQGNYTGPEVPDSYLGAGPVRCRKDRLNYPGFGTAAGDAAVTAALSAIGWNVAE